jgi:uncharacterized protein HemY
MSDSPKGFVRRSTLVVAVIAALLVGGYAGGMSVLLFQGSQRPHEDGGPGGMPPGMPGGMPGGPPAGMPGGMPGGVPGGMPGGMGGQPDLTKHILEIEQELAVKPGQKDLWVELGNLYYDADQPAKSIAAYEKAEALGAKSPDMITDMGVMYRRLNQPQKAMEQFDRAIALDPGHEVARYNKGVVALHDLNDPAAAVRTWEELLKLKPGAKTPDGRPLSGLLEDMKKKAASQPKP